MEAALRTYLEDGNLAWVTARAARIGRAVRFKYSSLPLEAEDISQDLLLDWTARLKKFDPRRGSLRTFTNVVFGNRVRKVVRDCFVQNGLFLSIPIDHSSKSEPVADSESWTARRDATSGADLALLWPRVVPCLTASARRFMDLVLDEPANAALLQKGHRSTFYRSRTELRRQLTMLGVPA